MNGPSTRLMGRRGSGGGGGGGGGRSSSPLSARSPHLSPVHRSSSGGGGGEGGGGDSEIDRQARASLETYVSTLFDRQLHFEAETQHRLEALEERLRVFGRELVQPNRVASREGSFHRLGGGEPPQPYSQGRVKKGSVSSMLRSEPLRQELQRPGKAKGGGGGGRPPLPLQGREGNAEDGPRSPLSYDPPEGGPMEEYSSTDDVSGDGSPASHRRGGPGGQQHGRRPPPLPRTSSSSQPASRSRRGSRLDKSAAPRATASFPHTTGGGGGGGGGGDASAAPPTRDVRMDRNATMAQVVKDVGKGGAHVRPLLEEDEEKDTHWEAIHHAIARLKSDEKSPSGGRGPSSPGGIPLKSTLTAFFHAAVQANENPTKGFHYTPREASKWPLTERDGAESGGGSGTNAGGRPPVVPWVASGDGSGGGGGGGGGLGVGEALQALAASAAAKGGRGPAPPASGHGIPPTATGGVVGSSRPARLPADHPLVGRSGDDGDGGGEMGKGSGTGVWRSPSTGAAGSVPPLAPLGRAERGRGETVEEAADGRPSPRTAAGQRSYDTDPKGAEGPPGGTSGEVAPMTLDSPPFGMVTDISARRKEHVGGGGGGGGQQWGQEPASRPVPSRLVVTMNGVGKAEEASGAPEVVPSPTRRGSRGLSLPEHPSAVAPLPSTVSRLGGGRAALQGPEEVFLATLLRQSNPNASAAIQGAMASLATTRTALPYFTGESGGSRRGGGGAGPMSSVVPIMTSQLRSPLSKGAFGTSLVQRTFAVPTPTRSPAMHHSDGPSSPSESDIDGPQATLRPQTSPASGHPSSGFEPHQTSRTTASPLHGEKHKSSPAPHAEHASAGGEQKGGGAPSPTRSSEGMKEEESSPLSRNIATERGRRETQKGGSHEAEGGTAGHPTNRKGTSPRHSTSWSSLEAMQRARSKELHDALREKNGCVVENCAWCDNSPVFSSLV